MDYLDTVQSPTFRFQFMAFVFSLPKTLQLWGFVVFLGNCLLVVAEYVGIRAAIAITAISLLLIGTLYCTTSEAFHTACDTFTGMFRRRNEDTTGQMV